MFHRIKSETLNEEKQMDTKEQEKQEADVIAAPEQAEVKDVKQDNTDTRSGVDLAKQEQDKPPTASQAEEATNTEETPSTQTENQEDKKDMTDQSTSAKPSAETASEKEKAYSPSPAEAPASPYSRAGQRPLRPAVGGGYPGSYSAAGVSSYKPATPAPASDSERRLTIGAGITMSGEIEACDYLLVEGTVEAALKGARMLDVAESGTFYGTVEIQEATISGRFEGDITVHGRLTLASTAVITGAITYSELEVEAGAIIDGRLTPTASAPMQSAAPQPQTEKTAHVVNADDSNAATPANEGSLFSQAPASAAE